MKPRLHLLALASLALLSQAHAQSAQPTDSGNKLDRVEVTGSMLKRTDTETTAPVTILKREDILRAGATTLDELLRMDASVGTGGLDDIGTGNGFAAGTASISMRGMGSAATLVLINGRRMAPAGVVDPNSGQSTVFNVNAIPMSAIERVEILKSGASSLYGSDALAGVVNIILRNDYQGALVETNAKQRFDGLFRSQTANVMVGVGDIARDGYNLMLGAEIFIRDGVGINEAPNLVHGDLLTTLYSRLTPSSTSSYPGNLYTYNAGKAGSFRGMLSSSCATQGPVSSTVSTPRCLWDSTQYAQYTGDQKRGSVFARGSLAVGGATLSAELMASRVKNDYTDSPTSRTESLTTWGDSQGKTVQFMGLALPANHPDNPTRLASASNPVLLPNSTGTTTRYTAPTVMGLRYRFADLPYDYHTQADNVRAVISGSMTLAGWDIDGGLLHHYQKNTKQLTGRLSLSGLNKVLADGSYRFGGKNSPEVLAILSPALNDWGTAATSSLDLRGSRELWSMTGGAAMLGLGAELRHENFEVAADPRTAAGDIIGRGIGEARGSRNVSAAYAELALPFAKGLETQIALRAEHYTDFGNAVTAKLGAKYKLSDWAAVRGTWANGFRAPSLSQISTSSVFSFSSGYRDPRLCPTVNSANTNCSLSLSTVSLANPNLKPEKSDSYTLGLLLSPAQGMDVVLDAWYIERRGEVDRLSAQEILNRESQFPGMVMRLPPSAGETLGQVYQVRRPYQNLARSSAGGLDYEFSQRLGLAEYSRLKLSLKGTRMLSRKEQYEEGLPDIETLGYYKVPRDKLQISANWSQGDWSVTLSGNHQSGFQSFDADSSCDSTLTAAGYGNLCHMKAWRTADLSISYKGFKGIRLSGTVRNLADSRPPFDPNETEVGVSGGVANAYGRYLSVNASYEF
ncbi:TonB-dependent receptor domain-containing protein [Roseateles asaccharophilus]|uniref:Iron complex outermembrane receptor protein n=1 Tax=Roseateles asaccharophilus TaxID=582607 RepID=A0ABU2ACF4_9BURK|nr:TonB-dependent receptor [Roseateles asaccharophilus]MDR7334860.1 iron complex outermembrane receptor protein [Roseateles asaccharophilus]